MIDPRTVVIAASGRLVPVSMAPWKLAACRQAAAIEVARVPPRAGPRLAFTSTHSTMNAPSNWQPCRLAPVKSASGRYAFAKLASTRLAAPAMELEIRVASVNIAPFRLDPVNSQKVR